MEIVERLRSEKLKSAVAFLDRNTTSMIYVETRMIQDQIVLSSPAIAKVSLHITKELYLNAKRWLLCAYSYA